MLDFPSTGLVPGTTTYTGPSGQEWLWDGQKWVAVGGGGGGGTTIPDGTANGQLLVWDGTAWVPQAQTKTGTTDTFVMQQGPTINQPKLMGVTDGSNAAPGEVGEYIFSEQSGAFDSGSAPSLTLSIPVGDWDVSATVSVRLMYAASALGAFFAFIHIPPYQNMWPYIGIGGRVLGMMPVGTALSAVQFAPIRVSTTSVSVATLSYASHSIAPLLESSHGARLYARRIR